MAMMPYTALVGEGLRMLRTLRRYVPGLSAYRG
jgi:hypothetical protein